MMKVKWIDASGSAMLYEFEGRTQTGIDFSSGIFAANLGHRSILDLNDLLPEIYGSVHAYHWDTNIKDEYKHRLLELTGFDEVLFFSDGTTAVEAAYRMFKHNHPDRYLHAVKDAFHGRSWAPSKMFKRLSVRDLLIASQPLHQPLIMEGYRGWDAHFWNQDGPEMIHAIDDAPFLIFDEIQSGFYRTGKLFAYQWYSIRKPDLVVIGKGMGNGFPMSGILVRSKDLLPPNYEDDFSSTHGGNPLAMAFGLAALEEYAKPLPAYDLPALLNAVGIGCQGRGMVAAILMPETRATEAFKECLRRGLFCVHTGKDSLKLGPPLNIPEEKLLGGIKILKEVLCGL